MRYRDLPRPSVLEAPDTPRKLRLWTHQWLGLPFLFAIPLLALAGFFGDAQDHSVIRANSIQLTTDSPKRTRHGWDEELRVSVHNISPRPIPEVTVSFDPAYLRKFNELRISPQPQQKAYEVKLSNLKPGENREVLVELEARDVGTHEGEIQITAGAIQLAKAHVSTFTFP